MKKNKSNDLLDTIAKVVLGILLTLGVVYFLLPKFERPLTDAQIAEKYKQSFKEVEAVCGKENVKKICINDKDGCQYYDVNIKGFTCGDWKMALHPEEYDENGQRIYKEEK